VKTQRDALKEHLSSIGGSESNPIKSAVAGIVGAAAGLIDNLRTKGESKSLRDDYTAFNLAAIGYGMLHTTAHALGQMSTMEIADRHLRAYAKAVQEINQLMPGLVAYELREDGHAVNDSAVEHCVEAINRAWRDTGPGDMPMKRAA